MLSLLKLTSLLVVSASTAFAAKSAGCAKALPANYSPGGTSQPSCIISGELNRTFLLYIPKNYNINTGAPLIISYHGNTRTGAEQEIVSEFSLDKWNTDFVVAYPDGVGKSWEGASYSTPGVDDVAFTGDLLDHLESTLCIDTDRLYAAGKSNGGGFVGLLTCDSVMSKRITAFAAVSGAFYPGTREPCNPSGNHVPVMEFHGMADKTIEYYGGTGAGGELLSIDKWFEIKVGLDKVGCSEEPDSLEVLKDGLVWKRIWYCGATNGKRVLVAYNETNMQHKWPGTEQTGDDLVIATPRIIEFFNEWP